MPASCRYSGTVFQRFGLQLIGAPTSVLEQPGEFVLSITGPPSLCGWPPTALPFVLIEPVSQVIRFGSVDEITLSKYASPTRKLSASVKWRGRSSRR